MGKAIVTASVRASKASTNTARRSSRLRSIRLSRWFIRPAPQGHGLLVGGLTQNSQSSAASTAWSTTTMTHLVKIRHPSVEIETESGCKYTLHGGMDEKSSLKYFPLSVIHAFSTGFPLTWEEYTRAESPSTASQVKRAASSPTTTEGRNKEKGNGESKRAAKKSKNTTSLQILCKSDGVGGGKSKASKQAAEKKKE